MKRLIITIQRIFFISFILLYAGCAVLQPAPPTAGIAVEPHPPAVHHGSTSRQVVFSVDFTEKDKSVDLIFFVPPERDIGIEVIDFELEGVDTETERSPEEIENIKELIRTNVSISSRGYMRLNRMAQVRVQPRIVSEEKEYRLRSVKAALTFEPYHTSNKRSDDVLESPEHGFGKLARHRVVNYSDYDRFANPDPPLSLDMGDTSWRTLLDDEMGNNGVVWRKVLIGEPGFYRLSYNYIKDLGINVNELHPRTISVYYNGKQMPRMIYGGLAKTFTPADSILFYAQPSGSTFTPDAAYWLRIDTTNGALAGKDMEKVEYAPAETTSLRAPGFFIDRKRVEEDNELKIQTGNFLAIKGMRWVDEEIPANEPYTVTFDLPTIAARTPGESELTLSFYLQKMVYKPSDTYKVTLNDYTFESLTLRGFGKDSIELNVPYSELKQRDNRLTIFIETLQEREQSSGVYMDYFELTYPRRFMATDNTFTIDFSHSIIKDTPEAEIIRCDIKAFQPDTFIAGFEVDETYTPRVVALANTGRPGSLTVHLPVSDTKKFYFLPPAAIPSPPPARPAKYERLSAPEHAAGYLIISHELFMEEARSLVDLKKRMGSTTALVDVESVYNEFTYGNQSPIAIKRFLRTAVTRWESPPEYVLLVGDSTSDYLRKTRNEVVNYVPSYTITREKADEEWASDHWYTTLCGEDDFADIIIGRISVNNRDDAQTVIDKIIAYETERDPALWNATLGYVADQGEFDKQNEEIRREYTPQHYASKTVYLDEMPFEDNFYLPKKMVEAQKFKVSSATTNRIKEIIEQGIAMLTYYGHGSPNIWSDERIWFGGDSANSDNLNLRNGTRLPFIVNMTCNSGAIDYPVPKWNVCVSEDFMRVPRGGAVGLYVPAGPGFTAQHKKVSIGLRHALFKEGFRRIGDAVVAGQYHYLLNNNDTVMVRMFILLGDPALSLKLTHKRFDMNITPRYAGLGDESTFTVQGSVPGMNNGTVQFWVTDPDNEDVGDRVEKTFTGSRIKHTFTVNPPLKRGKWIVRAYCTEENEATADDAIGSVAFYIDSPYLIVRDVNVHENEKSGAMDETAILHATLENPGYVPVDGAKGAVEHKGEGGEWNVVQEQPSLEILPGAAKVVRVPVTPDEGLNLYRLSLKNYFTPPEPTIEPVPQKLVPVYVSSETVPHSGIIMPPELLSLDLKSSNQDGSLLLTLSGTVVYSGTASDDNIIVYLRNKNGEEMAKKIYPSRTFVDHMATYRIGTTLNTFEELDSLVLTAELESTSQEEVSITENNSIYLDKDMVALPDLAISREDITFSEETPTEGVTVFMDITVHNKGDGAAENFTVAAFDGNPNEKGRILRNVIHNRARHTLPYLAPNSRTNIRLRWDPVKNQGYQTLWFKADSNNSVPEKNADNNSAAARLYVKEKAKLQPGGILMKPQTEQEKEKGIIRLQAAVQNRGETAARNIFVEFFKTEEQTPENLIGKSFIPEIQPGEQKLAVISWEIKSEERHQKVRPTYRIFLKGSLQRISSISDGDDDGDTE